MTIDIAPLLSHIKDEIAVDFSVLDEEMKTPVHLLGTLTRKGAGDKKQILFNGVISYSFTAKCDRCLKDCNVPVEFYCSEEFSNTKTEDSEAFLFEGNEVNFADMFFANIIFSKPLKVLCQEDCKGLCPVCGVNFNIASCDCEGKKRNMAFNTLLESFGDDGGV